MTTLSPPVTVLDVLQLVAGLIASGITLWPFAEAAQRLGIQGNQVHREAYLSMFAEGPLLSHNFYVDVKLRAILAAITKLETRR